MFFVFVLFVCFLTGVIEKYTNLLKKHPSLLVQITILTNTFPLIKLKETWLLVFYTKKNLACCLVNTKIHLKIVNPLAIHFIAWKSLTDGKILKTCALRPAGIYGEGELRHLPRIVVSLKFYFIFLGSRILLLVHFCKIKL